MIYSLKVFIVFVVLGLPFPQVHLSVGGGGGGGGGGHQASSLSSKHKLWNFHRYSLVYTNLAKSLFKFTEKVLCKCINTPLL